MDPDSVVMQRYSNGKWNVLDTEMKGEDDEYYYYEAYSPGFSYFAITSEEKINDVPAEEPKDEVEEEIEEIAEETKEETQDNKVTGQVVLDVNNTNNPKAIYFFISTIALLGSALMLYFKAKKK